jgi:hypothetical protein
MTKPALALVPTPAPDPVPEFLTGITAGKCCNGCSANRCVISGVGICAHPNMGGLQDAIGRRDVAALDRFQQARAHLAGAKISYEELSKLAEPMT